MLKLNHVQKIAKDAAEAKRKKEVEEQRKAAQAAIRGEIRRCEVAILGAAKEGKNEASLVFDEHPAQGTLTVLAEFVGDCQREGDRWRVTFTW